MQHKTNTQALSPLPDDIFLQIILYLTVREARIASFVSKKWLAKINAHSSFWKSKLALHFPQMSYAPESAAVPISAGQWKAKLARKYTRENNWATQTTNIAMLQDLRSWREGPELIIPVLARVTYEQLRPFLAWLVRQGKQELLDRIYAIKSVDLKKSKIGFAITCHQPTSVLQELINNHEPCDLTDLLFVAAEVDHCDAIKMILALDSGLKLNQQYYNARFFTTLSPISAAIQRGSVTFIKELIASNASNGPENQFLLPPSLAILSGNVEAVKLIYDFTDVSLRDAITGKTPLHIAAEMGEEDVVEFLVSRNVPLDAVDANGNTPVFFAASHNKLEILQQLKYAGANLHWRNSAGDTLLHAAVRGEDSFVVLKWLITEKIIDIQTRNNEGKTVLHIAAESLYENALIFEYLINLGLAVSVEDINRRQPLHLAVIAKYSKNIKKLLESGADINAQDKDGNTPLHHAVLDLTARRYSDNTLDIIEYLMNQGAATLRNGLNKTPQDIALEEGYEAAIRRFFPANTGTKEKPRANYIDLHNAAKAGKTKCITILLANGVEIDATDLEGRTALHLAVMERKLNTAKYLIGRGARKDIRDGKGKLAKDYLSKYMGGYIPLLTPNQDNRPAAAALNRADHVVAAPEKSPSVVMSGKRGSDYAATELEDQRPNQLFKGGRL